MKRFFAAAFLVVSNLACANAHEVSEAYSACLEKAAGAMPSVHDCIAEELVRQDKRIAAAYDVLMTSPLVTERRKSELRDVQQKWIAFRDANCAYYDDTSLGRMAGLAARECVLTSTADRAFELEILRPEK